MATQQLIIDVVTKNTQRLDQIERALNRTNRSLQTTSKFASTAGKLLAGAFAVNLLLKYANGIKEITADFQRYHNQLRLITKGEQDRNRVFNELVNMAKQNRTEFGATVDLYTKLRVSTEQLGVSEDRVANVTSKLSRALQLAGADGNTASSVIRQFGQAMASGEVRGDEFRSLVEGLGPALTIMARETGINVGELRKMSQAGELSAMVMFEMLEKSTAIDTEFNKMNATLDQSEQAFKDAFARAVEGSDLAKGATELYHNVLKALTKTLDRMAGIRPFKDATDDMLEQAVKAGKYNDVAYELSLRQKDIAGGYTDMGDEAAAYNIAADEQNIAIQQQINRYKELNKEYEANQELLKRLTESNKKFVDRQRLHIEMTQKEIELEKEKQKKKAEADKKRDDDLKKYLESQENFLKSIETLDEDALEQSLRTERERIAQLEEIRSQDVKNYEKYTDLITKAEKAGSNERFKIYQDEQAKRQQQHQKAIANIKQGKIEELDFDTMTTKQKIEVASAGFSSILENAATFNKKAFEMNKKAQIAMAIVNTAAGVTQALKTYPPPFSFIMAAAQFAAGVAQINAIKSTQFQGREMGGPVQKGKSYIVGEAGQEAFIPNQNGTIVPNHELGGKNEITINFNVDATDAASFDSMLVERRDTIVAVINEALNENGRRALV